MAETYFVGMSTKSFRNFINGNNGKNISGHYAPQAFRHPLDALENAYREASNLLSRMAVLTYNFQYTRSNRKGVVVGSKYRSEYREAFRETVDNGLEELIKKYVDKKDMEKALLDLTLKRKNLDRLITGKYSRNY